MSQPSGSVPPGNPAQVYEEHFVPVMFLPWADELIKRVQPQPGERALDIACGTGAVCRLIKPLLGPEGSITGIDANPAMLEVARERTTGNGVGVEFQQSSAESLPFEESSFDLVLCQHGLQFFTNRLTALREMRRVLRPEGRAGITVWQSVEQQTVFKAFDDGWERHFGQADSNAPFSLGDANELRQLLLDAGFREVSIDAVTRDVRFPSADRFVRMTTLGAAAVMPEYEDMDDGERDRLVATITDYMRETLDTYSDGPALVFPMKANIAVARP